MSKFGELPRDSRERQLAKEDRIERYSMDYAGCPEENPSGEWVKAKDVVELEEHVTAYQLRVDNDLLRLKAAYSLAGSE